ncbi:MAG TPA: lysozyme [Caulobacteraceae bacterium]|jgi:lysozyme|nr:lysozyme [Caulobacteraceae bacterium]
MTPHPRLSKAGIDLVKRFEGLRRKAARLEGGGWTIGYGHTASAREGAEVTADQAEQLLIYDLDRVARAIDPLIFTPLNANQFNALVAFAFNVGVENFRASAVLKRLNEGALLQAGAALELWRRAAFRGDSLVVDGLVRRRAAEKALFLTPPNGFQPVPTPVVRPAYDAAADLEIQARGLAGAADLYAPLDGEHAVTERSSIEDAARNVAERLQSLLPEPEPKDPAPPPFHAPKPSAEPVPEPPAPPIIDKPGQPFLAEAAASAPQVFEPQMFEPQAFETPSADFGRRQGGEPAPPPAPPSSLAVLGLGLIGVLMFVGALLAMIYDKATLLNLGIGLIGVVCMVPAGLRLLLRLFGERRGG